MGTEELLKEVLMLKPQDKFIFLEAILKSLDKPDEAVEEIWKEEAERRVQALKEGRLETIPYEDIFP